MARLTGFDVYVNYVACKCHFNQLKYNVLKYKRANTSVHSWNKRHDKMQFEIAAKRLTDKNDLIKFLIANFVEDKDFYIGHEHAFQVYKKWNGRNNNLKYTVTEDINTIAKYVALNNLSWEEMIFSKTMMQFGIRRMISIETFVLFDIHLGIFKYFDENCPDFIWESLSLPYSKYGLFYKNAMSKEELRNAIKEKHKKQ